MERNEARYRVVAALLQAGEPLTLSELVRVSQLTQADLAPVLRELVADAQVIEGKLLSFKSSPQYCWATRWEQKAQRRTVGSRQQLEDVIRSAGTIPRAQLDVHSAPTQAFYEYVIGEYRPPEDKRFLVFLQCSVRRPFSTSPSHASMRRAIRVATRSDPSQDFESCPVHVVVLASKIGPVPYELEDIYPANVRGGGVKGYTGEHYDRVRPVLAERMAQYVVVHRGNYDRIAAFAQGRYGEVMAAARSIVAKRCADPSPFVILPREGGASIESMGESKPCTYWARYWIQLYLEIVSWLEPAQRHGAAARLRALHVHLSPPSHEEVTTGEGGEQP